jgi:N6-L-threonylcarbamoyladenine synthase
MVGLMTAKAIAAVHDLPLVAVNHLEAHALSARLIADDLDFPFLVLLISGGHCQWLAAEGVGAYRRLGTTLDDAVGEAFDKSARLLGLPYPGGPALERAARDGDPTRFPLPRPMLRRPGCDFSFAGLKTAVATRVAECGGTEALDTRDVADIAASFQEAVCDVLADRLANAAKIFRDRYPRGERLVVAGGVAANAALRARLETAAADKGLTLVVPPPALCTDNAAMVAWAGLERLRLGLADGLDAPAKARWPLDPDAPPAIGAGVKA